MAPCPKVSSSSSLGVSWADAPGSPPGSAPGPGPPGWPPGHTRPGRRRCWQWIVGWKCAAHSGAHTAPPACKAPRSARINASTPAASSSSRYPGSPGHLVSPGHGVHRHMDPNPPLMGKGHRRGSSSGVKFPAKERIPKLVPAKYTASAPYSTAMSAAPYPRRGPGAQGSWVSSSSSLPFPKLSRNCSCSSKVSEKWWVRSSSKA